MLDVEHAALHGGEPSLMPFDLNIRLSASVDAWYAATPQAWEEALLRPCHMRTSVSLVEILKMLWNPRATASAVDSSDSFPHGCNTALYGLLSIALELRRRKEVKFLDPSSNAGISTSLASLGNTVIQSLRNWEPLWAKVAVPDGLTASFLWRDCSCMIYLAYTLYEIGPVDLQTVAGKMVIEGKRRGATDYAKSRRKTARWVKEDRAWLGLARKLSFFPLVCLSPLWADLDGRRRGHRHPGSHLRRHSRRGALSPLPMVLVPSHADLLEFRLRPHREKFV
jgi:hypothetical protein